MLIGVDTGGTFTDLVLVDPDPTADPRVRTFKVPSTPSDFAAGVLDGVRGIRDLHTAPDATRGRPDDAAFALLHATTVATNALLERAGARVTLVTTAGFEDVLAIGRQTRPSLYNLRATRPPPLVPRERRLGIVERVEPDGSIAEPITDAALADLVDRVRATQPEAIAICLLFGFANPQHELAIAKALADALPNVPISRASDIAPEFREFERTSTTAANAFVQPVMTRYLRRLEADAAAMGATQTRIVQSNAGLLSVEQAGDRAVRTLLSGPAAGVQGALAVARQALQQDDVDLITFDMGGTSTDVALIAAGTPAVTHESILDGLPIRAEMLDIHTVGAGGGSVAAIDAGGALQVGPRSAGAEPGPACYARSETLLPTVTDANAVLGRLDPARFLGGCMTLDVDRARRGIASLAEPLNSTVEDVAAAILRLVNANMEAAIRKVSVQRGRDPRAFTLVSFGGAGGLHACDVADALSMPRVLVPVNPGVLSAWGAVSSDAMLDVSQTVMLTRPTDGKADDELATIISTVVDDRSRDLIAAMQADGFDAGSLTIDARIDARYVGQSHELSVPLTDPAETAAAFHAAHRDRYGHADEKADVELVTVRLRAIAARTKPTLQPIAKADDPDDVTAAVVNTIGETRFIDRDALRAGHRIRGEAVILEAFATTRVPAGWQAEVDAWGHLHLQRLPQQPS